MNKAYIENYYRQMILELKTARTDQEHNQILKALQLISVTAADLYGVEYADSLRERFYSPKEN